MPTSIAAPMPAGTSAWLTTRPQERWQAPAMHGMPARAHGHSGVADCAGTGLARRCGWRTRVWMSGVKDKIWFLREGLFAKYVIALVGLVVFVLAVNGATGNLDQLSRHQDHADRRDVGEGRGDRQADRAVDVRPRAADQLGDPRQLRRRSSSTAPTTPNCCNRCRAVSQLSLLNGQGREQLRLSRTTIAGRQQRAISPATSRFTETVARGVSYAPAYFRGDAALHVDLGVAFRLQRRRHRRRNRPRASCRTSSATPRSARRLRLCGRFQGPGAGEFGQGPRRRQGSLEPAAGRRADRRPTARRWRPAPTPTAIRC